MSQIENPEVDDIEEEEEEDDNVYYDMNFREPMIKQALLEYAQRHQGHKALGASFSMKRQGSARLVANVKFGPPTDSLEVIPEELRRPSVGIPQHQPLPVAAVSTTERLHLEMINSYVEPEQLPSEQELKEEQLDLVIPEEEPQPEPEPEVVASKQEEEEEPDMFADAL